VIKESGAEILRLWIASTDYHEDMRCSTEILQRVSEAYRKIRNTARFALGNLDGFDPARDSVTYADMMRMDAWAVGELRRTVERVRAAYDAYEFHTVYQTLYNFCTVTLSARYFDIIKDRLYTFAPKSHARRSAQTALHQITESLATMLAPILVFTAEEIWENLPTNTGEHGKQSSVHIAEFPTMPEATVERAGDGR
jgi:isoleucyl-tRNA synthetase